MYAYILGEPSVKVAEEVMKTSDLRNIRGFNSVGDFLSLANRQGLKFQRLVILTTEVKNEQEFQSLSRYCSEVSPSTEIVLLGREINSDDRLVLESFYRVFKLPIYTDYSLSPQEGTSYPLLRDLLKFQIDTIRLEHSVNKDNKPVVKMAKHEATNTEVSRDTRPKPMRANYGVVKSFTFGGKFFGRKKYTKAQLEQISRLVSEANVIVSMIGGS